MNLHRFFVRFTKQLKKEKQLQEITTFPLALNISGTTMTFHIMSETAAR